MSGNLIYEAKYRVHSDITDLKAIIQKILEEQEGFIRTNQSLPFSADFSANLKYTHDYQRFELPLKMKIKKFFDLLSEKDEGEYHYDQTLINNKPEIIHVVQASINPLDGDASELIVRSEPTAVHRESRFGWSTEELSEKERWRIHDRQQNFLNKYFRPIASEVIEEPAPVSEKALNLSDRLKQTLPQRSLQDFKEANRCFAINCNQAAMAMLARGFEVALARKLEVDINEGTIIDSTNPDGTKRYKSLSSLIKKAEEEYEIPNRLRKNDINWSRVASVHFSDDYSIGERRVRNVFTDITDYLSEIYDQRLNEERRS